MATRQPPARQRTGGNTLAMYTRAKTVEEVGKVLRTLIVAGAAVLMAMYCSRSIHDLAGKTTAADIGLQLLGNISISEGLAYAVSVVCVGFAYQRGRTNQSLAKRLSRLSHLEQQIDPNRSSSHLGETGAPREEDR